MRIPENNPNPEIPNIIQGTGTPKKMPGSSSQADSVQISSQCLPIEQITTSAIGISGGVTGATLNWPAWNNGLTLHSATDLKLGVWTTVTNAPVATNGINFLTLVPTNNQMWFRLQLP